MFNPFNPNLRNSLPKNILPSGWRASKSRAFASQDPGLHQDSLYGYRVITCPAEPDTPFPAHLIIPELIPHAHVIEPNPGNKDHEPDKLSWKGNTHINLVRFWGNYHRNYLAGKDEHDNQDEVNNEPCYKWNRGFEQRIKREDLTFYHRKFSWLVNYSM